MAPGPTFAATSGLPPRGDLAGRRHHTFSGPADEWTRMSSGDGWVTCAAGHRHWGRFGAAGLLILDGDRVILQHRAPWTHDGDTYGVPGGARDSFEDAVAAAVREADEEAGLVRDDVDPLGVYVDDHGGWSYSTVVAAPARPIEPRATNAESVSVRWHRVDEVARLPLHRGFAATWPILRHRPPRLRLVVPPRTVSARRRRGPLLSDGVPVGRLGREDLGVHRLYPHLSPSEPDDLVLTVGSRGRPAAAGLMRILLPPSRGQALRADGDKPLAERARTARSTRLRSQTLAALAELVQRPDAAEALLLPASVAASCLGRQRPGPHLRHPAGPATLCRRRVRRPGRGPAVGRCSTSGQSRSARVLRPVRRLRGGDPVPAYRVPAKAVLPGLGSAGTFWRRRLAD